MKFENIFRAVIHKVLAHTTGVFVMAVLLTVLAFLIIVFRFDIRSDLKDLMPQDAMSVVDTFRISDRLGSIQALQIIVETPELRLVSEEQRQSDLYKACVEQLPMSDGFAAEKPPIGEHWCDSTLVLFGSQFVHRIAELDSVGNISFFNDKRFFEDNIMLYADVDDLEKAYREIDERLTEARRQSGEYKACLIAESDEAACESLRPGLQQEGDKTQGNSLRDQLMERYQASELAQIKTLPLEQLSDGAWILRLNVRFKGSMTSVKSVQQEVKRIEEIVAQMDMPGKYDPTLKIVYGGGLNDLKAEYSAIVTDIVRSISITILSILALIAIFFKSPRSAFRIFVPLIMSTLWSLAITFMTIGYLNIITAFIFALLLGLGIDFGIHLYARYNRERALGKSVEDALTISVVETGTPIFFGALTTAAVFFSLMLGSFRGFTEFGFVAGIGVLLAVMTMCTVLPAMTVLSEKIKPSKVRPLKNTASLSAEKSRRFSPAILGISLVAVGFGIWCVSCIPNIQFEENFYRLRMREDPNSVHKKQAERYKETSLRPSSPTYALMDSPEEVAALEMILRRNIEYKRFNLYRKMFDFYPNTLEYLNDTFSEVLPYSGQQRTWPMIAAMSRLIPERERNDISVVPLSPTYGAQKSHVLRKVKAFALAYPETAKTLSGLFSEVLTESNTYDALPVVVWEQSVLPRAFWVTIPTQRPSRQLSSIAEFASIFSYIPGTTLQQQERLEVIDRIRERTSDRNIRFLPTEEKKNIQDFRRYFVDHTVSIDDLPEWVKVQFKEGGEHPLPPREGSGVDYAFGNICVMYQATSTYVGYQAHLLTQEVRSLRVNDKRLTASTSAFVYSDMLDLIKTDGVRTSGLALLLILLIVFIQQKNPILALVVSLPVMFGLGTTVAVMTWFDLKLGLFNIVMLPVTLGIGIDGSIYLLQRYQTLGRGSILEAVRQVGGPVFMSSATTVVGFGGMTMSQHMGLNTMGQLAIIGISICFCSTFLIEPGLIVLTEKLGIKALTDHDFEPDKSEAASADDAEASSDGTTSEATV